MRVRRHILVFSVVLGLTLLPLSPVMAAHHRHAAAGSPNIVLILLDDLRFDFLPYMPIVQQELVGKGVTFTQAFVENSLCCPSRASILTGNDSHTTDVYQNEPPHGGYPTFHDRGEESSTIATWLQGSGYHTGLVGKYLNLYGPDNLAIPPGWDRWVAFDGENAAYYNYELNVDGVIQQHGEASTDYSTDVLAGQASSFITDAPAGQPLFLYFAPFAPHTPSRPAPRDIGTVTSPPPFPPGVYERSVKDKPKYVQHRDRVDEKTLATRYIHTIESLAAADDAVGSILDALTSTGRLSNTMIVFTSDNGYMLGEHHLLGKQVPYEESIRVPLVIRDDALLSGTSERAQLVSNTDFAPTFADLAGVSHPPTDGQSLLPVLEDPTLPGRDALLIEHLRTPYQHVEFSDLPSYCAARTRSRVFVHYQSGFEELYNLGVDPAELLNRAGTKGYHHETTIMKGYARALCTPLPPGMTPF